MKRIETIVTRLRANADRTNFSFKEQCNLYDLIRETADILEIINRDTYRIFGKEAMEKYWEGYGCKFNKLNKKTSTE